MTMEFRGPLPWLATTALAGMTLAASVIGCGAQPAYSAGPAASAPRKADTNGAASPPVAKPDVSASVPAGSDEQQTVTRLLGLLTPQQRQALPLLHLLCEVGIEQLQGFVSGVHSPVVVGCSCGPRFAPSCMGPESCPPTGLGRIVAGSRYHLLGVYEGHFTALGRPQIVASFSGCESGAENFGSSYVIERDAAGAKVLSHHVGLYAKTCDVVEQKGSVDRLVCFQSGPKGTQAYVALYRMRPAQREPHIQVLAEYFNELPLCQYEPGYRFGSTTLRSLRVEDANGDNINDVIVDIDYVDTVLTKATMQGCELPFESPNRPLKLPHNTAPTQMSMIYLGPRFQPSAATLRHQAIIRHYEQ